MGKGCEQIEWGNPILRVPDPANFPTYYPDIPAPANLKPHLQHKFGPPMVAAFGYGSFYNNEASPDSEIDVLVVSTSAREFHDRGVLINPTDYRTSHNPRFHAAANLAGPSYYHSEVIVGEQPMKAKYAVLDLPRFVTYAHGSMRDAFQDGTGNGFFAIAGRTQKALLIPIVTGDEKAQLAIDTAVNQSRIDGAWLALALLPERFSYPEFALDYTNVSYKGDLRPEKKSKAQGLIDRNPMEYVQMFEGVLGEFIDKGILDEIGEGYFQKRYSLSEQAVLSYLKTSALYSGFMNLFGNALTTDFKTGCEYIFRKGRRAWIANHSS